MALFNKKPKTSAQKAQKAQMGIFARLIGCGYLIYIVIKLLTTAPEDDTLNPTLKIVISIFFLLAAGAVITITIIDFVRNLKSGTYKTASYTDDIIETYASNDFDPPPAQTETAAQEIIDEPTDGKDFVVAPDAEPPENLSAEDKDATDDEA